MQFFRQSLQNLPRGISLLRKDIKQKGPLNRRILQVLLYDGQISFRHVFQNLSELPNVSLRNRERDIRPTHGRRERQTDTVGDNNGHAAKGNRLNKSRTPRGPPERT